MKIHLLSRPAAKLPKMTVYFSDKKTPYEYTDIHYDELPELLRQEIRNGKYIESTAELYGFLENYSS